MSSAAAQRSVAAGAALLNAGGGAVTTRAFASKSSIYMPSFRSGIAQRPNSRPDNQPTSPRERSHRMPVTHSAHEWRAAPLTEEESNAKFKETVGEAYAANNPAAHTDLQERSAAERAFRVSSVIEGLPEAKA